VAVGGGGGGGGDAKLPVGTPRHANLQSSLCRHSNISLMPSQQCPNSELCKSIMPRMKSRQSLVDVRYFRQAAEKLICYQ